MSSQSMRRYWPYDEVLVTREDSDRLRIQAPWLQFSVTVAPGDLDRAVHVANRLGATDINAEDVEDISWFFSRLSKFPMAYTLPGESCQGTDKHVASGAVGADPKQFLIGLAAGSAGESRTRGFAARTLPAQWSWDQDAALGFSQTAGGHDPATLLSVARRFHLLNDLENNRTAELLNSVRAMRADSERFRQASALIVRQNHYITLQCDRTLRAALPIAQGAFDEVLDFIEEEAGHDRILLKAIHALGMEPEQVPVLDSAYVLMEAFRFAAERNLLGFAMIVDIFERTSYEGGDPMAELLVAGGEEKAASAMDKHREINDSGEHENVAASFVREMAAVDADYAREALYLAELVTLVVHQVSAETLESLRAGALVG